MKTDWRVLKNAFLIENGITGSPYQAPVQKRPDPGSYLYCCQLSENIKDKQK